jgi:hypothetical protein
MMQQINMSTYKVLSILGSVAVFCSAVLVLSFEGIVIHFINTVYETWGILDPYAIALGGWLKMNPSLVWPVAGFAVFLGLLLIIWRHTSLFESKTHDRTVLEHSSLWPDGSQGRVPSKSIARTYVDEGSIQLAGTIRALMERSLKYSFRLPLHDDDPFLARYEDLENSDHPIWTEKETNQLRRDFLHHIGLVGHEMAKSRQGMQADRRDLQTIGGKLISRLTRQNDEIMEEQLAKVSTRT